MLESNIVNPSSWNCWDDGSHALGTCFHLHFKFLLVILPRLHLTLQFTFLLPWRNETQHEKSRLTAKMMGHRFIVNISQRGHSLECPADSESWDNVSSHGNSAKMERKEPLTELPAPPTLQALLQVSRKMQVFVLLWVSAAKWQRFRGPAPPFPNLGQCCRVGAH